MASVLHPSEPLTPPQEHTKTHYIAAPGGFRKHLPDLTTERFRRASSQNANSYSAYFNERHAPPWLFDLTQTWARLYTKPFYGITTDGTRQSDLFQHENSGIDPHPIVKAADRLLSLLSPVEQSALLYSIDAREWRAWSNPEVLLRPFGLRLENIAAEASDAVLAVVEATLSPEGYAKALAAMRINAFLGELCGMQSIMNARSYNFLVFGTPSATEPWGWSLYGHHLCLSVFLWGSQIVVSPTFTGAEPTCIDEGLFAGTTILGEEGAFGLQLMQSLNEAERATAQTYKLLKDPQMRRTGDLETDQWNPDDQRCLCGAFRDNRIVPYEGICVSELNYEQRALLLELAQHFLLYLPAEARRRRLRQIEEHFDETFFSWIGNYGNDDSFYYRVQSPVIILEFDHHSGVFLNNTKPAKFHVHTIVRTPNGGDYGWALQERDI
ncbi:hypothetical protein FH972_021276 [Carpinus fangiana]|uniref:DUF3500 domain-containing protein n=1 Tax=Carpinus fangiana TaxID=176857 RepID=A0A5N6KNV8_9ROSI|nr:hypothetical protein FH972_021276 [Carpinus fangiana]